MSKDKKAKKPHIEKGFLKADFWLYKKIFSYSPAYLISNVLYGVLMGIWPAMGILYTERLYDEIGRGEIFEKILVLVIAYFSVMLIIRGFNTVYQLYMLPRFREVIHRRLYTDIFEHARRADLSNYDDPEFFNDYVMSTQPVWGHTVQLIEGTGWLIRDIVALVVSAGVIVGIEPLVALLIFVSGVARIIISRFSNKLYVREEEEQNPIRRRGDYVKRVFTIPDYAKELHTTRVSENLVDAYSKSCDERKDITLKYGKKYLLCDFVFLVFLDVANYAVLILLLYKLMMVPNSGVTLGGFAVGVNAIWSISWRIEAIGERLMDFHKHGIFIKKLIGFFEKKPKIVGGDIAPEPFESLSIKNLGFAYSEKEAEVRALDGVNMEIHRGERIAIVGYNGAGKTTLTKLIMRLYDASEGEILYNGRDLREYELDGLRNRFAAVFQDYRIFAATVAENVAGGELSDGDAGEAQRQRIIEALKKSTFEDRLATMHSGIDTQLTREFSDEGVELSGGEAQKIAIARAFYKDADLIILDEPSSALDPNAEYELNKAISDYAEDKTVVFISHRLSTTRHADRIYMFDGGKLIESGTHEELMQLNGKYAYMFNLQAEKYR